MNFFRPLPASLVGPHKPCDPTLGVSSESYAEPSVESKVATKILSRAEAGRKKYGVGMEREDLTRIEWLRHAQEEAMDLAMYLQKLIDIEEQNQSKAFQPTYI